MKITATQIRQECKRILVLAMPIIVAQFAQTANGFVDTVMAGRVGPDDLAAVAVGAAVWVPVFLFLVGVMQGLTPFVSQYRGQQDHSAIGVVVQQGLWLALPLGWLGFLLMRHLDPLLDLMDVDPVIRPMIVGYLKGLSWGFPAITLIRTQTPDTVATIRLPLSRHTEIQGKKTVRIVGLEVVAQ